MKRDETLTETLERRNTRRVEGRIQKSEDNDKTATSDSDVQMETQDDEVADLGTPALFYEDGFEYTEDESPAAAGDARTGEDGGQDVEVLDSSRQAQKQGEAAPSNRAKKHRVMLLESLSKMLRVQ